MKSPIQPRRKTRKQAKRANHDYWESADREYRPLNATKAKKRSGERTGERTERK